MKSLHLTWFHLKRILFQNWGIFVMTFVMPLGIILAFLFIMGSDSSLMVDQESAILNYSSFVEEKIKPHLAETYQENFTDNSEEALRQLDQIEISMVYEIPEGFPETDETIQVHSLNGTNRDPMFEVAFTNILTNTMIDQIYNEADINFQSTDVAQPEVKTSYVALDSNMSFVVFMMLFFMGYTTGFIAGDLVKMRKEGLLTRSLISNTYGWQILGSVLAAYMIYSTLSSLLIVLISSLLFSIPMTNFALIISLIVSMAIFIAGLTMLLFRIFKNEALIQILGILVVMALVFIPLFTQSLEQFNFLQYLSPYYWMFEAIDTGQILPNALVIALYGLVLFTAGSFKVERLVKA